MAQTLPGKTIGRYMYRKIILLIEKSGNLIANSRPVNGSRCL